MIFEMFVGLHVIDDKQYAQYRAAMTPILESYGGGFNHDFRVSEVLKPQSDSAINRVFTIYFPDEDHKERFFADSAYAEVRAHYFEGAVASTTILASYEREPEAA